MSLAISAPPTIPAGTFSMMQSPHPESESTTRQSALKSAKARMRVRATRLSGSARQPAFAGSSALEPQSTIDLKGIALLDVIPAHLVTPPCEATVFRAEVLDLEPCGEPASIVHRVTGPVQASPDDRVIEGDPIPGYHQDYSFRLAASHNHAPFDLVPQLLHHCVLCRVCPPPNATRCSLELTLTPIHVEVPVCWVHPADVT
mmetsp:Transcript_109710/g.305773  ORF Transcript_109710/g.305773 Transcript_109710/m.305773 type:complete len:202 (+) Transcript_109710:181-786(+)